MVCACAIHESGRGVVPCMYHADVIREHQAMYRALASLEDGTAKNDPETLAANTLLNVRFRHAR